MLMIGACYGGLTNAPPLTRFWDQETWMWPPLLLLQPQLAQSALQYRYLRRAAAAELAAHYGHSGLRFPWESAQTGVETETGGGKFATCAVYEIHISGDICKCVCACPPLAQPRGCEKDGGGCRRVMVRTVLTPRHLTRYAFSAQVLRSGNIGQRNNRLHGSLMVGQRSFVESRRSLHPE
jgi:hypothetical protein